MKLKAQVRFPVCVLYSMAFWLLRISPDAKFGGMLNEVWEGERAGGIGGRIGVREDMRESERGYERE